MAESKQATPTSTADVAEKASNDSQKGHVESPEFLEEQANANEQASDEVEDYQRSTELAIDKNAFRRLVREIAQYHKDDLKFQAAGIDAMHECAEAYLVSMFKGANRMTGYNNRITVQSIDMRREKRLREQLANEGSRQTRNDLNTSFMGMLKQDVLSRGS